MVVHPSRSIGSNSPEQTQLEAIHTATLERLESLNESLIRETHTYRTKIDEEYLERKKEIEDKYKQDAKLLKGKFSEKSDKLDLEKAELENLRNSLDDRNNTHARREIRKDILKEIKNRQEKFELTTGTNRLRKPIFIAMLGLITVFVVFGIVSIFEFYELIKGTDYNKIILVAAKQLAYSVGVICSILYLIRWQNRWFEQHATSEFQLKQFELDMERASWLVETSLEWKDAKGTAIPAELLDSLSKNLFSDKNTKVKTLQHPADQLASALMGSASAVKLKTGDSSIEIDPKKLAKTHKSKT